MNLIRRFRVAEASMSPTLQPGDLVVAVRDRTPSAGSLVVFPHPDHDHMWLVKRASAVSGGEAWVESDNPDVTEADSRRLGWIDTTSMYRVILRYRPPLSLSRPR